MARKLYRKELMDGRVKVPPRLQVLWNEETPEGREVIEFAPILLGPKGKWAEMQIKTGEVYTPRLQSGRYLITNHTRTTARLTLRQFLEIEGMTARLVNGVVTCTDDQYVEEDQ